MQQMNYTIVGFRHHAWQGEGLAERLRQAQGKRIVLMHEETNVWNGEATAAYIDTEMVGYVSNDECHLSTTYCDLSAAHLLIGHITQVDVEHHRATATVSLNETTAANNRSAGTDGYEAWEQQHADIPVMGCTTDELRLRMLQCDLAALLANDEGLDATLRRDLEAYERLLPYDVSREATIGRRHIVDLMLQSSHGDIREWGRRLDISITTMGAPETRRQLADYFCTTLTATSQFRDMAARAAATDPALLEHALRQFPHHLYDEYHVSAADFVGKLYYRRVPARPLRRFVSGLLLLEHLRGQLTAVSRHESALADALSYAARIDHCATAPWQELIQPLWQRIATTFAQRITQTHGAKDTTFSRRFVCQVVGTLLALGVYRQDIAQTEYTRLLEGSARSSLRKNINQGVDSDDARHMLKRLVELR